eukprot:TRINITY_DN3777_c0_g1_i4.p1 TRINITY_DN3777_c0_g1~~TRINITY_DN3777_c0_g1_i4.p1  ORF type:complete len:547 (-),score=46.59 TRINITY_DN3777_c0_g1_i4:62-1702(-)
MMRSLIVILGVAVAIHGVSSAVYCPQGRWLKLSDKSCQACPENCGICNAINDQPNCLECLNAYAIDLSGAVATCFKCAAGCKYCTGPKAEDCVEAQAGFAPKSGTKDLIKCPANCEYCSAEGKCATCRYDHFLDKDACVKCPANCMSCKKESETATAATCLKCDQGYSLAADKTCKAFPSGCLEYTGTSCTKCINSHYLVNGECQSCSSYCQKCASADKCTECTPKMYYLKSDGTCEDCKYIDRNCRECDNNQKCLACNPIQIYAGSNNRLTLVNNKCVECPFNCDKCDGNAVCLECKKDAKLVDGKCVRTSISNCDEIDGELTKCKKCIKGYRLIEGGASCEHFICPFDGQGMDGERKCVDCIPNCKICDMKNKICIDTAPGYYFDGTDVKPCQKGCAQCKKENDKEVCTMTANYQQYSFAILRVNYKNGVIGYTCDKSCGLCFKTDDPNTCKSCRPGGVRAYYPSRNKEIYGYMFSCIDATAQCERPISNGVSIWCLMEDPNAPEKPSGAGGISAGGKTGGGKNGKRIALILSLLLAITSLFLI